MEIEEVSANNYEGIRHFTIRPEGRAVVMLTGASAQGKSSALDALWFGLTGTAAITGRATGESEKERSALGKKLRRSGILTGTKDRANIIRDGAESATVRITMRNGSSQKIVVTRTMGRSGNQPTVKVEGRGEQTPQDFLNTLLGSFTFDPLEFIRMEPEEQVDELKRLSGVTLDFGELDAANKQDYDERVNVGREIKRLKGEKDGMGPILAGLPPEKLDEEAIFEKLNRAGEANERAKKQDADKRNLGAVAAQLGVDATRKQSEITLLEAEIKKLQASLNKRREELDGIENARDAAVNVYKAAPDGEYVDTVALTAELRSAQRNNEAIDKRHRYDAIQAQIEAQDEIYERLTRQMDTREEKKKEAIRDAKIPVPGLTFDAQFVRYNGRALGNLSGGEQLRVSTLIGMASNSKLKIMCIRNGEALDKAGIAAIEAAAKEHKYQVWMTRLDETGQVGIVFQDGEVLVDNDRKEKQ